MNSRQENGPDKEAIADAVSEALAADSSGSNQQQSQNTNEGNDDDNRGFFSRTVLATIGAAAMTTSAINDIIDSMVRQGDITQEEGRKIINQAQGKSSEEGTQSTASGTVDVQSNRRSRSTGDWTDRLLDAFNDRLDDMGFLRQDDLRNLELKLDQLEHRLTLIEAEERRSPVPYSQTQPDPDTKS